MKVLRKQGAMRRVIAASLPCVAGAVYFFGWRSLVMVLVSSLCGFAAEYVFCRGRREPVSEAVFVTAVLYALIMPPTVPWFVLVVGVVFGVVFTKEVFGGFGRNVFNPAMSARCFVYICFPVFMTSRWVEAADGRWGALAQWSVASVPDAITQATPMTAMKAGEAVPALSELFFGRISGTMGVTSALLILIGGIYLFYTRTASRTLIVSVIVSYALLNQALHMFGVEPVPDALHALLGGGFLFGAFFMVTDPVTAPRTEAGRVIYAVLIAACTVVIRNFSIFNGGLMFSILLGNMFAPIIDRAVKHYAAKG